jgi:hypothetical protein
MKSRMIRLICATAILAITAPLFAQFGHPLKGSWSGEWWVKKGDENRILLDFDWDGKALKGVLNPGTDNSALQNLTLQTPPINDVSKGMDPWLLHFEADTKDASGKPAHVVVDGKLQNIGAYSKFITGTWTIGGRKAEFKVTRN